MSGVFETLQERYRELVERGVGGAADEAFVDAARAFLIDARRGGAAVADAGERSQLRAYMRFVGLALHRAGQDVPELELLPLDRERWPAAVPAGQPPPVPWWAWVLIGAAAFVVLAGLVAVAGYAAGVLAAGPATPVPPTATAVPPTPTATATPIPPTETPTATATATATATPTPPAAAFDNVAIALGVDGAGEPLLAGDVFDWNTKTVYVVFDYAGMQDGPEWSAVWTRNGAEVGREAGMWDVARYGAAGRRWAVLVAPAGDVLYGGEYVVTLAIGGEVQAERAFRVQYYVTPAP
ncbi:MAG: hypothetical protein JXD18_00410 [Anaerolineae bacterium]|nr:hypothetical protein [Anaerolineae bacterium]